MVAPKSLASLYTSAKSNPRGRVLGEVEKDIFISLPGNKVFFNYLINLGAPGLSCDSRIWFPFQGWNSRPPSPALGVQSLPLHHWVSLTWAPSWICCVCVSLCISSPDCPLGRWAVGQRKKESLTHSPGREPFPPVSALLPAPLSTNASAWWRLCVGGGGHSKYVWNRNPFKRRTVKKKLSEVSGQRGRPEWGKRGDGGWQWDAPNLRHWWQSFPRE